MQHDPYVMRECVKAWLEEVRRRQLECKELEYRIQELRDRLDGMSSSLGNDGTHGGDGDRIASGIARLEEMERNWNELMRSDSDFIANAVELCRPLHVERYACYLHWVKRDTWAQVGRRIGYSEQHTRCEICDVGVCELYPLIPEEFRRYTFPNAMA